jgi:hypothetical protein
LLLSFSNDFLKLEGFVHVKKNGTSSDYIYLNAKQINNSNKVNVSIKKDNRKHFKPLIA